MMARSERTLCILMPKKVAVDPTPITCAFKSSAIHLYPLTEWTYELPMRMNRQSEPRIDQRAMDFLVPHILKNRHPR